MAIQDLKSWMENDFVNILINGGDGIQGLTQTDFFNYISSPAGLGEIGIARKHLSDFTNAYRASLKVRANNKGLSLAFGDMATLKLMTPHPAAGVGNLHVESWLEFFLPGQVQVASAFVPESRLPGKAKKVIRSKDVSGGLMLPVGSYGVNQPWSPIFNKGKDYNTRWLDDNLKDIENAIVDKLIFFLQKRMNS